MVTGGCPCKRYCTDTLAVVGVGLASVRYSVKEPPV